MTKLKTQVYNNFKEKGKANYQTNRQMSSQVRRWKLIIE